MPLPKGNKKLHRIEGRQMISGVCAGVADYFDAPVTVVRILTVLFGLCFGVGFLVYAVLMTILPDEYGSR
ncbi:MAG: PspC domain-containing protein [Bacillota bacterium]|nr:PspC domain-containing protein [Bacillota bacterium]